LIRSDGVVAISQVGACTATNEWLPKHDTILHANPRILQSPFLFSQLITVSERVRTEISILSGYRKNCGVAKRARIEFLVAVSTVNLQNLTNKILTLTVQSSKSRAEPTLSVMNRRQGMAV